MLVNLNAVMSIIFNIPSAMASTVSPAAHHLDCPDAHTRSSHVALFGA